MRFSFFLLVPLCCLAATPALAYEEGDLILRLGAARVSPDVSGDGMLAGFDVEDDTQLGLSATWMLNPKLGLGLLGATPFKHDLAVTGIKVGETRQLPPTLTVQLFPISSARVQPYVGIGLNYTTFFEEKIAAPVELKLTDSFGLALEAGIDIALNDRLLLNVAAWKIDIDTDVKLNGNKLGEMEIDPLAAMVGIGFKF